MRELVPSDIIIQKLSRDGNLKVTEEEVEDALESTSPAVCMLLSPSPPLLLPPDFRHAFTSQIVNGASEIIS